jgi:hypothetical protein
MAVKPVSSKQTTDVLKWCRCPTPAGDFPGQKRLTGIPLPGPPPVADELTR